LGKEPSKQTIKVNDMISYGALLELVGEFGKNPYTPIGYRMFLESFKAEFNREPTVTEFKAVFKLPGD
jgi:hypothetical protein